jgi:large subunit ribosomal protein L18
MFSREKRRRRIRMRIRKKVFGTSERPRLSVSRSLRNLYLQVIDDIVSTNEPEFKGRAPRGGGNIEGARIAGTMVAERARQLGLSEVVFDRGGHLYHGRVKAVAEAVREAGLKC